MRYLSFKNSLISLIILSGALTLLAREYPYLPLDREVTELIHSISFPGFNKLMEYLSWLGYYPQSIWLTGLASLLVVVWLGRLSGLMILVSTAGAILTSIIFKLLVGRVRPDLTTYDSFPSGHVLFYMGLIGVLTYLIYTRLPVGIVRKVGVFGGIMVIILAGLSRIYLGAHWFSDVMGGYLLGLLWLLVVVKIFPHARSSAKASLR